MESYSEINRPAQTPESRAKVLVKEAFNLAKTDPKLAVERMRDAIQADEQNLDTQCEYAWLLGKDCQKVAEARRVVEKVLQTNNQHQQALMLIAIFLSDDFEYLSKDQPRNMIDQRKQYLNLSINSAAKGKWVAHAYMYLAKILYYLEGQAKAALDMLEKVISIKPNQMEPYMALVEISFELQVYEKALRYCKQGLKILHYKQNTGLLYFASQIIYYQHIQGNESNRDREIDQKEQEVIQYATDFLKKCTSREKLDDFMISRELHVKYVRARCYFNQKQAKNALADFEDILLIQQDYLDVMLRKAELLFIFHKPKEALELFQQAELVLPQDRFSAYDLNLKIRYEKLSNNSIEQIE